ncbi:MAG: hypothetical protein ABW184_04105 [Sphingobium sp.]
MLDIAPPQLSPSEWNGVRKALDAVAECGCTAAPPPGSIRDRLGRAVDAIAGRERPAVALSPRETAVRDFLCDSGRTRRIAQSHVVTLGSLGFTLAQIEAMALLGA